MTAVTAAPDGRNAAGHRRFPTWLLCLLLLTFVIGTDDFVIAGVLGDVSEDLDVTQAAAGQLVTVFSLTYAIAAPVAAVFTARLPRRTVMITGMLLFAALNALAGLAPNYPALMACRVLAAITASIMTPAAFATAATLAPPEKIGRFLGTVTTGLTFSLIVGVPIGTWLGGSLGWRSTMFFIVFLSLIVALGLVLFMPALDKAPPLTLKQRLAPLAAKSVLATLVAMVPAAAGGLMAFIYISPIAADLSGASANELALLIAVIGIAGVAGAKIGGWGADKWGPERTVILALAVQTVATLVLTMFGWLWNGQMPIVLVGLVLACWQIGGWAFNSPIQMRMMRIAGPSGGEALALNISAMYIGIAVAGMAGGAALSGSGATGVLITSSTFAVVGMLMFAGSFRLRITSPSATAATSESTNLTNEKA